MKKRVCKFFLTAAAALSTLFLLFSGDCGSNGGGSDTFVTFEKTFDPWGAPDIAGCVSQTSDGGFISAGRAGSVDTDDIYLIKAAPDGTVRL